MKTANIHRLIISDSDGFNEQVLLKSNSAIISPAWSSDAQQIAYVSFENNRAQVFTQNLVSGQRELIISSRSSVSSPAWSPNNEELAFASTKDGNSEIYVINLRNKNINRLTENIAIDTEPAWSPDGKKIIFTSDRSGSPQIYEIDIRTKLKRRLTTVGTYNARASYLSNKEIILVHRNLTNFNIASLNLNTRDLSVLTSTKNDESPCIAPNGNVIIYATKDGNLSYLAGVNISSKVSFKLPALYGELKEPAWSPFIR
jgi:TolB protein